MMPASSNSFTVRYTVEIEILSSTATQRRYNSSTSGWSTASASTRAMTRRCSVMRMPVAAQRVSIVVPLGAEVVFSAVMMFALEQRTFRRNGCSLARKSCVLLWFGAAGQTGGRFRRSRSECFATLPTLRQVAAHQQGVQMFPVRLLIITFATAGDAKSGPFVQPSRGLIMFLDLEKHRANAMARQISEMSQQQIAGQAAAAMACRHRHRKYFG